MMDKDGLEYFHTKNQLKELAWIIALRELDDAIDKLASIEMRDDPFTPDEWDYILCHIRVIHQRLTNKHAPGLSKVAV